MVMHELREHLRALNADLMFLQEVQGGHAKPGAAVRRLAGPAAARVHRRFGLDRFRVRPQRGIRRRASRQCDPEPLPDRALGQRGHFGASLREPRPAALRDRSAGIEAAAALHLRASGAQRARPPAPGGRAGRAHAAPGPGTRAADRRRGFQRLARQSRRKAPRASLGCAKRSSIIAAGRRAASRADFPCFASTASTCAASACTRPRSTMDRRGRASPTMRR